MPIKIRGISHQGQVRHNMKYTRIGTLTAALMLIATMASAGTILQFTEVFPFNAPFTFTENGTNTATTITASKLINVTFDHSLCLVVGCGGAADGVYSLTLNATSIGAATLAAGAVTQAFGGSLSIIQGGFNLLTVNFTDLLQGSLNGGNPTLQASQPPDVFSGTSNVLDSLKLGQPRGFSFSFSNLSNGGLGINGTSIRSGTADASGTFNATATVPEPTSMLLLGSGLLMVARRLRKQ